MMNRPFAIVVALIFSVVGHAQEVVEAPERLENVIITFTEFGRDSINQIKCSFVVRGQGELEGLWEEGKFGSFTTNYREAPDGSFTYKRLDQKGRADLVVWWDGESEPVTKELEFRSENTASNIAGNYRYGSEGVTLHAIDSDQQMLNLSNRCEISAQGSAHSGFVLKDSGKYLVRVVGPTLAAFGVETPVRAPAAEVHIVGSLRPLSELAAGRSAPPAVHRAAARLVGSFPLPESSADVAFVAQLRPGAYVIEARNPTSEAGEVLIEMYALPLP